MSGHTPGPWYRSGCTVYALNDRKSCNRFAAQVQDAHTPREELEAVARLMQAAPDLLSALELMLDGQRCRITMINSDGPLPTDKARAAIAKAKGEA